MREFWQLLLLILPLIVEWMKESSAQSKKIAHEKKQKYKRRKKAKLAAAGSGDAKRLVRGM